MTKRPQRTMRIENKAMLEEQKSGTRLTNREMCEWRTTNMNREAKTNMPQMLGEFGGAFAGTFIFNTPLNLRTAQKKGVSFFNAMSKELIGTRKYTRCKKSGLLMPIQAFVIVEHFNSNIHLHASVRMKPKHYSEFMAKAAKKWQDVSKIGGCELDLKVIDGQEGWCVYIAKDLNKVENQEAWFIYDR